MIDPVALLIHLLLPYWWIVPILLVLGWLQSPSGKGWCGEAWLDFVLHMALPRERYHMRRNLTLPTADGTTQIDHVVVSRHGVFVIETKNYRGWIFGKPGAKTWTQQLYHRKHAFQNPLRQNYKHIRTLTELTGADERAVFSLIAFVGTAEFRTPMPPNVTNVPGCLDFIRAHTASLLDDAEVARLLAAIDKGRLAPTRRTHAAHVAHVRALQADRAAGKPSAATAARAATPSGPQPAPVAAAAAQEHATALATPLRPACPMCGCAVGEYTYKSGDKAGRSFHGCTQFPACTYRADLSA